MLGNITMYRYKKKPDVTSTLEDRLEVSYKAKHSLTIESNNHTLRCLPNWIEMLYLHKNLHVNVYRSFIQNR